MHRTLIRIYRAEEIETYYSFKQNGPHVATSEKSKVCNNVAFKKTDFLR